MDSRTAPTTFTMITVLLFVILINVILLRTLQLAIESQKFQQDVFARLDSIEKKLDASDKDTEEGIDGLHLLLDQRGTNIYVIQDTLVRIYHYIQPHKSKIEGCPECYKFVEMIKNGREFKDPLSGWSPEFQHVTIPKH